MRGAVRRWRRPFGLDEKEFAARLQELVEAEGALKVAVTLKARGPSTMRQLVDACGYSQPFVFKVRSTLEAWGFVQVGWANKRDQEISLTPEGEKFVALIHKQAALIVDTQKSAKRDPKG